jgi:hypothetical protein
MKKLIIILIGLVIVGNYAILTKSLAATQAANREAHQFQTITGKIIAINEKTRQIKIRIDNSSEEKKFVVSVKTIKLLKINEEISVKFEVGSHFARQVKVIKKHNNMVKK